MSDVSIYVALVSAGAAVIGAAVPQVTGAVRDARQARRNRRADDALLRRQACLDLLRAVGELRARVAGYYEQRGPDMPAHLAEVRRCLADTQLCVASVALLPPGSLANDANAIGNAAIALTDRAAGGTGISLGAMSGSPDFKELDGCVAAFRARAEAEARV